MPTAPLNLKGKLREEDSYILSEQRHADGSPVIVGIVANPQYRALFKAAPEMLAALEEIQQRYATTTEGGLIEVAIDTALYKKIGLAVTSARGLFNGRW